MKRVAWSTKNIQHRPPRSHGGEGEGECRSAAAAARPASTPDSAAGWSCAALPHGGSGRLDDGGTRVLPWRVGQGAASAARLGGRGRNSPRSGRLARHEGPGDPAFPQISAPSLLDYEERTGWHVETEPVKESPRRRDRDREAGRSPGRRRSRGAVPGRGREARRGGRSSSPAPRGLAGARGGRGLRGRGRRVRGRPEEAKEE